MKALATLLCTLMCASALYADYASVKAEAGAYYLDSKEDSTDQSIFQYHALSASLEKERVSAYLNGSYSDIYKTRGAEYNNEYRLALAKVGYTTADSALSGFAGRMHTALLNRTLWWDGAEITYLSHSLFELSAFGGYSVPNRYESDFVHTDSDFLTAGAAFTFTGIKNIIAKADYLKTSSDDKGTAGVGVNALIGERYDLYSTGVFDLNAGAVDHFVDHFNISGDMTLREHDRLTLSYSFDDATEDTTSYFDVLLHPSQHVINTGYYLFYNENIEAALIYGLLFYDDETAHMLSAQVTAYGAYLKYTKEFQSYSNMQEINAGYEYSLMKMLDLGVNTGYMTYTLGENKDEHTSLIAALNVEYEIIKNLSATVEYEFLKNREYSQDHRIFAGVTYSFFKGL